MLDQREVKQLNEFAGFFSFQITSHFKYFINCPAKILLLITGNQAGKTGGVAFNYVLRILGLHPIAKKNLTYFICQNKHCVAPCQVPVDGKCLECGEELKVYRRLSKTLRFCAETLPGQSANISKDGLSAEVKNTQYPELKKWLPPLLIKKDITFRSPSMILSDPYGGSDIIVEFVSYNQTTQSTAGTQRVSIWCDESPSPEFWEEQLPRLLAEDGDAIFTYTPVDRSSWLFDEFYNKAKWYYKTKAIVDFLKKENLEAKEIEITDNPYDIAVIQAATDDNPTLKPDVINAMFNNIDDPSALAIRRYGIFKQLSGRIFKEFDYNLHVIKGDVYFPSGISHEWVHGRGIDFHPQTSWACAIVSLSPQNEMFIWGEYNPSPEKYTIREIAHTFALLGKDYKFRLNLIDPLSEATKKDNITVKDDLNREFYNLKKDGIGTGASWISWDTKGEKGRDAIRERIKNSKVVQRPFNNKIVKNGIESYLPTIWVFDSCRLSANSLHNWRWTEWADSKSMITKDAKNAPEQKWSHFCMVFEALLKESAFKPYNGPRALDQNQYNYFRS